MRTIQNKPLSSRHKRPSCVCLLERFAKVEVFGDDEPHLIDLDDVEEVAKHHWNARGDKGYAQAHIGRGTMSLHRFVFGRVPNGLEIDHANQDRRDNRRSNLRAVAHGLNTQNSSGRGRSRFKGGSWDKPKKKWRAQIQVNRQRQHLGRFDNEIEAAHAYDRAATEHYGVDAATNFPQKNPQES